MSNWSDTWRKRSRAEVERQDAICGAIDRCLGRAIGAWQIRHEAQDMVRKPAGEPVDILQGSHLAWAAGYAHVVARVVAEFGEPDKAILSDAQLAKLFGVSRKVMVSRSDMLIEAHQADFLRAESALEWLVGGKTPTVARVHDAIANYPLPTGWPWSGDVYANQEFIAGLSPETAALGSVAGLILHEEEPDEAHVHRAPEVLVKAVLALDPDQYDAYTTLSILLEDHWRASEARKYEEIAFRRCMARITMPDGQWPERISSKHRGNVPILRTIIAKACRLWQRRQTDEALDLFRRVLRVDPLDPFLVTCHILAVRLGMRYLTFRDKLGTGEDMAELAKWFKANSARFPEEFDDWMDAAAAAYQQWEGQSLDEEGQSLDELPEPLYYPSRPEAVN